MLTLTHPTSTDMLVPAGQSVAEDEIGVSLADEDPRWESLALALEEDARALLQKLRELQIGSQGALPYI